MGEKKGLGCCISCPDGVIQEGNWSACTMRPVGCQILGYRPCGEHGKGNGCVGRARARVRSRSS